MDGLTYVPISDIGMEREENQDYQGQDLTPHGFLFVVADGMGGHAGGATASQMAVNHIKRAMREVNITEPDRALEYSIRYANQLIWQKSQARADLRGMGSTVVTLLLSGDIAWLAHVGDSRIYLLRGDRIMQLTKDHTMVQRLLDEGLLDEETARHHPTSHVLSRSLGGLQDVYVEIFDAPIRVQQGDIFLMCSDGLTGMLYDEEIATVLMDYEPHDAARILVDEANARGGHDNITIALVRVDQVPLREFFDPAQHPRSDADTLDTLPAIALNPADSDDPWSKAPDEPPSLDQDSAADDDDEADSGEADSIEPDNDGINSEEAPREEALTLADAPALLPDAPDEPTAPERASDDQGSDAPADAQGDDAPQGEEPQDQGEDQGTEATQGDAAQDNDAAAPEQHEPTPAPSAAISLREEAVPERGWTMTDMPSIIPKDEEDEDEDLKSVEDLWRDIEDSLPQEEPRGDASQDAAQPDGGEDSAGDPPSGDAPAPPAAEDPKEAPQDLETTDDEAAPVAAAPADEDTAEEAAPAEAPTEDPAPAEALAEDPAPAEAHAEDPAPAEALAEDPAPAEALAEEAPEVITSTPSPATAPEPGRYRIEPIEAEALAFRVIQITPEDARVLPLRRSVEPRKFDLPQPEVTHALMQAPAPTPWTLVLVAAAAALAVGVLVGFVGGRGPIDGLRADLTRQQQEKHNLQGQLDNARQNLDLKQEALSSREKDLEQLRLDLTAAQDRADALQRERDTLQTERDNLQEQLRQAQTPPQDQP